MFRTIRIFILLLILVSIAYSTWRTKTQSVEWKYTLPVVIYPINGDDSPVAADYLRTLTAADFKPIETFMRDEAARYGRSSFASIETRLGKVIASRPPLPARNGGTLDTIIWSLKMRWWAYRNADKVGHGIQARMFVLYFDPALSKKLDHSTSLQKGLIGLVKAFATRDMAKQNNVIITHEFLHTLGATDKYDKATNQPSYPDGYADPSLEPLLPQKYGEIMAGRLPLSETEAETPSSLDYTVIGNKTAREINW